jgi:hypothetical protein
MREREYDEAVEIMVNEGKSLSAGEREKALGPYDEIYLSDRIHHHNRRLNVRRGVVFILYLSLLVAVYTVFFYPVDNLTSQTWLKGTVILLTVLSLLGIPFLLMNHGRNASVLRAVRRLRQVELQDLRSTSEGVEPKRE